MSREYFYDCLNTHNCGYSFTSSKKERRCTRCDSSFIELRSVESKCEDNRICDGISNIEKCHIDRINQVRLATKDNSDTFTPERLLGVETDKGFVEGIASVDSNIYLITGSHIISASRCKFYISDDSDETVSFEEYVRIFYEE